MRPGRGVVFPYQGGVVIKSNWWSHPGMRLAFLRQLHTLVGAFIAPSVLFFALTGALQLFSLHEAHGDYAPPPLIEKLGKVHKDQVFEAAQKPHQPKPQGAAHEDAGHDHDADHDQELGTKPQAAAHEAADHDHDHERGPKLGTVLLKWVFLAVAVGLAVSTCLGVWMGIAHSRNKAAVWALLIAGAVVPVVLLLL